MGGGLFLPVCRMATLQLQMSVEGQDGVGNLLKIAQHSEERIFQAATDLVKIHLSVDWEALVGLICVLDDVPSQENYLHTFMSEVFRIATKKTDLASPNALETRPAVPGQVAIRADPAGYYFSHSWSSCQG